MCALFGPHGDNHAIDALEAAAWLIVAPLTVFRAGAEAVHIGQRDVPVSSP
jgi:hypothetical protein